MSGLKVREIICQECRVVVPDAHPNRRYCVACAQARRRDKVKVYIANRLADPVRKARSAAARRAAARARREDPEYRARDNEKHRVAMAARRKDPMVRAAVNATNKRCYRNRRLRAAASQLQQVAQVLGAV